MRRTSLLSKMHVSDERQRMSKSKIESYTSVWDALVDTPEQAASLRTRAELMQKIAAIVKENAWTQTEATSHCAVTQPRMNDLLRGRVWVGERHL